MCINYFNELIELIEQMDEILQEGKDDESIFAQRIEENFDSREQSSDILILRTMIENTILENLFNCKKELNIPTGADLRRLRLNILQQHFFQDYLPLLNMFGLGTTFNNREE